MVSSCNRSNSISYGGIIRIRLRVEVRLLPLSLLTTSSPVFILLFDTPFSMKIQVFFRMHPAIGISDDTDKSFAGEYAEQKKLNVAILISVCYNIFTFHNRQPVCGGSENAKQQT